jgi:hypothetical protein
MRTNNNLVIILGCLIAIVVFGFLIVLYSNLPGGDGTNPGQQKYLDSLKPPKPTSKEKEYMQRLQKRGFENVKFDIPIIGEYGKGRSDYKIELQCLFNLTEENKDSVIDLNEKIAREMYTSVISDSVIEDFGMLQIAFKIPESRIQITKWHDILVRKYSKFTLEKWCGFKVVKRSPNKFERVPLR